MGDEKLFFCNNHINRNLMELSFEILSKKTNRCDVYLASWCIYYLQGTLYPESSFLSKSLFVLNMAVAIYFFFYVNNNYVLPLFFKGLNLLLAMFTIYSIILYFEHGATFYAFGEVLSSGDYVKTIYLSLLSVYPFYHFSTEGYLTKEKLKMWAFVFFLVTTCSFFYERQKRMALLLQNGVNTEFITYNTGYVFLSLMPILVFFRKKPTLQYIGLAYCLYFVLTGMKRGAIFIAILSMIIFIYQNYKHSKSNQQVAYLILTLLFTFIAYKFLSETLFQNAYFQSRLEDTMEGDSSGRNEIYSSIWHVFVNSNIFNQVLGYGAQGSFMQTGKFAHCDWLELLINQGVLGVGIFAIYWILYYQTWEETTNTEVKNALGLLLMIFFIKSIFSMSYESMTFYTNSVLGYCLANQFYDEDVDTDELVEETYEQECI